MQQGNSTQPHLRLVSSDGTEPPQQQYTNTGSDGGGGNMEVRVKRLEEDVRDIKNTLGALHILCTKINTRLEHTPTTLGMIIMIITVFLGALAIPQIPNIINSSKKQTEQENNEPQRSHSQGQAQPVHQGTP